jgi:hypothetical protein
MISHLFFSQLVLIALVWLFVLLHLTGSRTTAASPQRSVRREPITPKRKKRSTEPKPFAGLTQKPSCPSCKAKMAHA